MKYLPFFLLINVGSIVMLSVSIILALAYGKKIGKIIAISAAPTYIVSAVIVFIIGTIHTSGDPHIDFAVLSTVLSGLLLIGISIYAVALHRQKKVSIIVISSTLAAIAFSIIFLTGLGILALSSI